MYGNNAASSHHPTASSQSQSQGQNGSGSNSLPSLLLNARLHELVIAGTGQNERLEPALEQVKIGLGLCNDHSY